jgi:hypothetical protein
LLSAGTEHCIVSPAFGNQQSAPIPAAGFSIRDRHLQALRGEKYATSIRNIVFCRVLPDSGHYTSISRKELLCAISEALHDSLSTTGSLSSAATELHSGADHKTPLCQTNSRLLSPARKALSDCDSQVLQATANLLRSPTSQLCRSSDLRCT